MKGPTTRMVGGFASGVLATACMSGSNTAIRRLKRPAEGGARRGPHHYEKVGQRAAELLKGEGTELEEATRVRVGEILHFGFGGVMGVVFLEGTERLPIPDRLRGSFHGLGLWAAAFAGYFPALKLTPGVWEWPREEIVSTVRAHLVYGNVVMLLTRGLEHTCRCLTTNR